MVAVWVGAGPIFHLPHPILLAVTVGLLELLPVAGPTVSAFLLIGTAVSQGGTAWSLVGIGLFCFALRMAIDQLVGPLVLGRAMRLPPAVVIFAFVAGAVLLGPLGVLLAIPGTALLKLALDNYYAMPVEPPPPP
jgi:predicted PurR-regulated permease PerM